MAVSIGPRIQVDGEAKYRQEINQIIQQAKTLDAEMNALTASFSANASEQEKARTVSEKLNEQLDVAKKRTELVREMTQKAAEATGENSAQTLKWREALANAEAQQHKLEQAVEENNRVINAQSEAVEADNQKLVGLGDQLSDITGILGVKLPGAAKDALNEMGSFSSGTIAAMSATATGIAAAYKVAAELFDMTKQAAAEADALLTRSLQTGLSTDLLQGLDYAQRFADFEGLDQTLTKITQSMGKAADGAGKQEEAFRRLGVSITDENGELRDNYEVFLDVIDALGNVQNETERDTIANDLFGKSFANMKPLVDAGSSALKKYVDEAERLGYIIDEKAIKRLGRLDDALQENDAAMGALKNTASADLAPVFQTVVDAGTAGANAFRWLLDNDFARAILDANIPLLGFLDGWSRAADGVYSYRDAQDEATTSTEDAAARIAPAVQSMEDSVAALRDRYDEAYEAASASVEGQFGLWETAVSAYEQSLAQMAEAAQKEWDSAYAAAEKSVQGQFKLMEEAAEATAKSAQDQIAALESQAAYWDSYSRNLDTLINSGIKGVEDYARAVVDGSKESGEALATFAAATDQEREKIVASFQTLQDKEAETARSIADLQTSGSEQMGALADSTNEAVNKMIAAQESQLNYWNDYSANLDSLLSRDIDGIKEFARNFADGSTESAGALAMLAGASDEQIAAIIASLGNTKSAEDNMKERFAALAVDVPGELKKIEASFGETIQNINGDSEKVDFSPFDTAVEEMFGFLKEQSTTAEENFGGTMTALGEISGTVDFAPFETSVDEAFGYLEDRSAASVETVRGQLAALSAEIDAVEARANSVNVGHNAGGTGNWRGGLTWVGESGPELVALPQGSQVFPNRDSERMAAESTAVQVDMTRVEQLLERIYGEFSSMRIRGRMM